jgi:dihydroorotate dehydrogenase
MKPLVLSAPFGEYLVWPGATSTLGTYTRERRAGALRRAWRVLSTVRCYRRLGAWVNKLGLPNSGMQDLLIRISSGRVSAEDKILSVSARSTEDWCWLIGAACYSARAGYLELNVSCPNCDDADTSDYDAVFRYAVSKFGDRAIVKLPPVGYLPTVDRALQSGVVSFHCCNTLPTPGGGLSGKPLKPLSLQAIADTRAAARDAGCALSYVIGGGGVTSLQDALDYTAAGATNIAVGSCLFKFWSWGRVKRIAERLQTEVR